MKKYLPPGDYLPHQKPLLLLDEVVSVTGQSSVSRVYVDCDHALAPFIDKDGVPGYFALELMAQNIGIWAGYWHLERTGRKIEFGMMLGGRGLDFKVPYFDMGLILDIRAKMLLDDGRMGSFEVEVVSGSRQLAAGRLNTLQADIDDVHKILQGGS